MVNQDWLATALETTGDFETAGNPWGGVTGNFDKMGISCGVLQWNIGSSSLQPLVIAAGQPAVMATMPKFGADFWRACTSSKSAGLAIVNGWQNGGTKLPKDVKAELVAFMVSAPMVAQQMKAAGTVAKTADKIATNWAATRGTAPHSKRDFCWSFDLVTQNGGLKSLTLADVRKFASDEGGPAAALNTICDELAAVPQGRTAFKDCWRNAQLWRGTIANDWRDLFILSYLRARKSKLEFVGLVMNRKGAIAAGQGWVNGEMMNFEGRF
jgi:hypothetical protein